MNTILGCSGFHSNRIYILGEILTHEAEPRPASSSKARKKYPSVVLNTIAKKDIARRYFPTLTYKQNCRSSEKGSFVEQEGMNCELVTWLTVIA